jgi:hypothetical protein
LSATVTRARCKTSTTPHRLAAATFAAVWTSYALFEESSDSRGRAESTPSTRGSDALRCLPSGLTTSSASRHRPDSPRPSEIQGRSSGGKKDTLAAPTPGASRDANSIRHPEIDTSAPRAPEHNTNDIRSTSHETSLRPSRQQLLPARPAGTQREPQRPNRISFPRATKQPAGPLA